MLIVETVGRIRREHFVLGKTIKEIARDLRLSPNTVRKVLRSAETAFSYEREVQPRPKLGRLTEELEGLLDRKERYGDLVIRNQVLLSLLICQGLQLGELTGLTIADVRLAEGTIDQVSKNDRVVEVYLGR